MEQSDPLLSAMQDVASVASQLREVKKRAEQYGQATSRLQEVSIALDQLARAVSSIQVQFLGLLSKADAATNQIEQARLTCESTAKTIPDIVARIETTDVYKSLGEFSRSLELVHGRITTQLSAIERMQALLSKERDEQKQMLEDVATRSERVVAAIERVAIDVASLKLASDKATDASATVGVKALQAAAELSKKIDAVQANLEAQNKILLALKEKKGFLF